MNLRQEAADVLRAVEFTGPKDEYGNSTAQAVFVLDALLDWFDADTGHIAEATAGYTGVEPQYFAIRRLVDVLRGGQGGR